MNFRHLKFFVATAESGQVSRAASALSISQSTVTTAIRDLERELGAQLFIRSAQGMEMTEAGRDFLASARDILERLDLARQTTRRQSPVGGVISVAATYTVMGYFLPYHLDRLARMFPNLEIRLSEQNRENIEEGLLSSRFDIGLVLTSNLSNPELETQTLFRSNRRLWVAQTNPLLQQGRAGFEEIAAQDYIMLTVDEAAHTTMKYWSRTGFQPRVRLRTSSVEAVRSIIANGQGVTILSDMVYRPWSLEGKRIGTVQTNEPVPSMDVGLAWRRGGAVSPAVAALRSYFAQTYMNPQSGVLPSRG